MAYLVYGVHEGEGFIAITGEIGAGKTRLANTLAHKLASRNLALAQVVSTHLKADDMVHLTLFCGSPRSSFWVLARAATQSKIIAFRRRGSAWGRSDPQRRPLPTRNRQPAHAVAPERERRAANNLHGKS